MSEFFEGIWSIWYRSIWYRGKFHDRLTIRKRKIQTFLLVSCSVCFHSPPQRLKGVSRVGKIRWAMCWVQAWGYVNPFVLSPALANRISVTNIQAFRGEMCYTLRKFYYKTGPVAVFTATPPFNSGLVKQENKALSCTMTLQLLKFKHSYLRQQRGM